MSPTCPALPPASTSLSLAHDSPQLRFQTLPYVVLNQIAFFCGSPQLAHAQRRQFCLPQPAQPDGDIFRLSETCQMMALVTRRMRFHTLRFDNCAVDDDRMEWLKGREELLSYVRHLVVGPKALSGCRCPSKIFQTLVSRMIQLEHLQYRSKRPLTLGLARKFSRLDTLKGVFVSGTGFTSSPALAVFRNLEHLVLFPGSMGSFVTIPPSVPPDSDDAWDPSRRSFDTHAIHQALAQSAHSLEQVYIAFGLERQGDEARRIFQLPAFDDSGCGSDSCVTTRSTATLTLPRLKQLFLRTSDLSDFFAPLLLGSPDLQSLWITHAALSSASHFDIPLAALPNLIELNVNFPLPPSSTDHEGLRNLVKGKASLKTLVLSENAPLETMFEGADGAGLQSFTTWGGVSRDLLLIVNDRMRGLRELSFEGSSWADEDLAMSDVPSLLSNLTQLKSIEMPCPTLPSPDIAPTFARYLHEAPPSGGSDPWLEAAALALFKTHLPAMMPTVRAFSEFTGIEELVLVSEHTEWRWRIECDDVALRMSFRPVMGGEVFGGGFIAPKSDAWSLGRALGSFSTGRSRYRVFPSTPEL